jgi:hypothetical protein
VARGKAPRLAIRDYGFAFYNIMTKTLIVLLTTMLAFAGAASSAEIADLAWNESNIKTLRGANNAEVFRFVTGGDPEAGVSSLNDLYMFDWYPAGDGKYELATGWSTGPEIATVTIYWQDAPRRIRSQDFYLSYSDHAGAEFADLNRDGKEELVLLEFLDSGVDDRRFVPNATWPTVYRLRGGQYVEASHEFSDYYENEFLPKLDKEISQALRDIRDVAARKAKPPPGIGPNDDSWQTPTRRWGALIMSRDKILRFLGRDPTAGLAQAREWMASPDPVLVDNARIVFHDIGGHEDEVRAAKLATENASKHWPNKRW